MLFVPQAAKLLAQSGKTLHRLITNINARQTHNAPVTPSEYPHKLPRSASPVTLAGQAGCHTRRALRACCQVPRRAKITRQRSALGGV